MVDSKSTRSSSIVHSSTHSVVSCASISLYCFFSNSWYSYCSCPTSFSSNCRPSSQISQNSL